MKILALTLLISFAQVAPAAVKIGVVNIQKVLNTVKEGKKANEKVRSAYKSKETELKRDNEKIKKAEESFRKKATILSAQERVKKQNELRKLITEFQQKNIKYEKELRTLKSKYETPIVKKLRPIIESVSKSKKVDFSVDAADNVDLTDAIIAAYDKKHK